ncbi:hypothetical protein D3C80_1663290 [compost metagenome]
MNASMSIELSCSSSIGTAMILELYLNTFRLTVPNDGSRAVAWAFSARISPSSAVPFEDGKLSGLPWAVFRISATARMPPNAFRDSIRLEATAAGTV